MFESESNNLAPITPIRRPCCAVAMISRGKIGLGLTHEFHAGHGYPETGPHNVLFREKAVTAFIPLLLLTAAMALKFLYALPLKDSLSWYLGVFTCFYVPGSLLLRFFGPKGKELSIRFFLSLGLGSSLVPVIWLLFRRSSMTELALPLGLCCVLVWFVLAMQDVKKFKWSHFSIAPRDIVLITGVTTILFLLLHLSHFTDIVLLKDGFKIRNSYLTETVFHLGLINSLTDTFPPPALYAGGGPDFSYYHLNMHLAVELLHRFFPVATLKLTFFYFPLLFFSLLAFLPYVFCKKFWGLPGLGAFCGLLMFGSDLSFIPGLFGRGAAEMPWTLFFPTTIWSLFTLNGYLPSLFVLILCIFYFKLFFNHGQTRMLLLLSLLGYAAFGFKTSMGLHIMAVALLVGLIMIFSRDDRRQGIQLSAAATFSLLMMFIDLKFFRGGAGEFTIAFDPFNQFQNSLQAINLSGISPFFLPLVFIGYLTATFSVRIFGISRVKDLFFKETRDFTILFLILFTLSGFFLAETIYLNNSSAINNAVWFTAQGLMGGWILYAYFLKDIDKNPKNRRQFYIMSAITVLLVVPTTAQFLTLRYDRKYVTMNKDALEVARYLKTTDPGSIVLHLPNNDHPSLASNLAGRPSVINVFRSFVTNRDNVSQRFNDALIFFSPYYSWRLKSLILKKYGVDYVYAPTTYTRILAEQPELQAVLKNSDFILYEVKR